MKNYVSAGSTLTFTNSTAAAIASGAGVVLGTIFGIANGPVAVGAEGVLNLVGEYEMPKAGAQAWALGAAIYWNATTGVATTVASGSTLIGVATRAVAGGAGDTVGRVRLNGSFG